VIRRLVTGVSVGQGRVGLEKGYEAWEAIMTGQRSRAYKLQLSEEGIQLFLRCHHRLCRLVGDFLPYGSTLYVAVAVFSRSSVEEQILELSDPSLLRLSGRTIRYVGTTPVLLDLVESIRAGVIQMNDIDSTPQHWKVFLGALTLMETAQDRQLITYFEDLRAITAMSKSPDKSLAKKRFPPDA
jgi:hypothetical protein